MRFFIETSAQKCPSSVFGGVALLSVQATEKAVTPAGGCPASVVANFGAAKQRSWTGLANHLLAQYPDFRLSAARKPCSTPSKEGQGKGSMGDHLTRLLLSVRLGSSSHVARLAHECVATCCRRRGYTAEQRGTLDCVRPQPQDSDRLKRWTNEGARDWLLGQLTTPKAAAVLLRSGPPCCKGESLLTIKSQRQY